MKGLSANENGTLYTTIDGVTYDITNFISKHPGGEDMIKLAAQRDATAIFHSYHCDIEKAQSYLKKLPIVDPKEAIHMETYDHNTNISSSAYHKELKTRVNQYFKANNLSKLGGSWMLTKSLMLLTVASFLYYLVVLSNVWILSPLLGVVSAVIGLSIQHDANHGSFSKNKFINRFFQFADDLIGGSSLMWRHQHVLSHHIFPNHFEEDVDSFSHNPHIRFNPKFELKWYHQFQHIYVPLMYSGVGLAYAFEDISIFLKGTYEHIKLQPLSLTDKVIFFGGKILHFFLFLILPLYLYGFDALWSIYFPAQLVGGCFLGSCFAVSHNVNGVEHNFGENVDWVETQIRTSANWSTHSKFWLYFSGGLNFQIEHHIFPGISHIHYPAISKIVKEFCEEKNLPYLNFPTFYDIYSDHIRFLYRMGHQKSLKN